ncbi:MAG: bifunctional DNA-formamidopyrimidine glycosylase/DNA-(apurinic or apyrimidinic site) lyase [Planctomycetaceae bacterium]
MPELPEVETMVRGVRPEVRGRKITDFEVCACSKKPISMTPTGRTFRRRVNGTVIQDVRRLAKRIVVELSSHDAIVIEPRMTGLLLVAAPPTREHRRLCFHLQAAEGMAESFEFWDRRGLGTVRLLTARQLAELSATLGPDALTITADELGRVLQGSIRPIKVLLLDQQRVAGIGNLYASEILHRARISPERPAAELTSKEIRRLTQSTHEILEMAIRYEGSTLSDGTYRNALNQDGGYQNEHRVYQKAGERCPDCRRGVIQRIVQAQRSTFVCPVCQK